MDPDKPLEGVRFLALQVTPPKLPSVLKAQLPADCCMGWVEQCIELDCAMTSILNSLFLHYVVTVLVPETKISSEV